MITKRINELKNLMLEKNIDAYIIPTSDFHSSEYVGEYFKIRSYMSGFTGSAGTLIVTHNQVALWTDGRYFLQASKELLNTSIILQKIGEPNTDSIEDYLYKNIKQGGTLGFDGKIINTSLIEKILNKLKSKRIKPICEYDLINEIWIDRPELSSEPVFLLSENYSGKSIGTKLKELRKQIKSHKATVNIITTLDDIAWLFNIRGNDIPYNPFVLSYAIITLDKAYLFINQNTLSKEIKEELINNNIIIDDYNNIYEFVKTLSNEETILLDKSKVNYLLYNNINKDIKIINKTNPTVLLKAVKNKIEIKNIKKSHIKDGVAFTKFMYWLKTNINKIEITEISASDYLENLRKQQEGFIELSFDTIAAYKENAAMLHYSANSNSNATLKPEGLLLIDSGGHYFDGTTDITRTIALGKLDDELKLHFTAVLKGMLNLSNAKFLYGCRGVNLDILARAPIWNLGIDYRCGTGHGIGYLSNVHEAPNGFRWKIVEERNDSCILEAGMITTNEPGIYIDGSHGIRIENELLCVELEKNEYGQFMGFETITYAPIDLDAVDTKYMNKAEIEALNKYHKVVYQKISPYLTDEEKKWLKEYTREV